MFKENKEGYREILYKYLSRFSQNRFCTCTITVSPSNRLISDVRITFFGKTYKKQYLFWNDCRATYLIVN